MSGEPLPNLRIPAEGRRPRKPLGTFALQDSVLLPPGGVAQRPGSPSPRAHACPECPALLPHVSHRGGWLAGWGLRLGAAIPLEPPSGAGGSGLITRRMTVAHGFLCQAEFQQYVFQLVSRPATRKGQWVLSGNTEGLSLLSGSSQPPPAGQQREGRP